MSDHVISFGHVSTRARLATLVTVLVALPALAVTAAPAVADDPAARKVAQRSLAVSPSVHIAGQAVSFRGSIGAPGVRAVHLQLHMGRPGDAWTDVPRSGSRTAADGSFDFVFPAPSMFKISYRVAGAGGLTTPAYLFWAPPQEITLTVQGQGFTSPFNTVAPGSTFTVVADTTPPVRRGMGTPPPIPGRVVLLQERAGTGWRTIAQGTADAAGKAAFTLTAPASGQRVLRARQERWTQGGSEIGWFASFPRYVVVGSGPSSDDDVAVGAGGGGLLDWWPFRARRASDGLRPTASQRYGWGPSRFDFAWERGQDLDSPPSRGTRLKGRWVEASDGTGRATPFNGALALQSKLEHLGDGDLGTTSATMRGNGMRTGRWEFRVQGRVFESGRPYQVRVELVPAGAPVATCVPESVVVGAFTLGTSGMEVGVRSQRAGSLWRRTAPAVRLGEEPMNIGVEIAKDHTTWFVEGRPVATTTSRKAWLGRALTPRLSMLGEQQEMAGTQVDSDWQRGWTLKRGKQVRSGKGLARSAYTPAC